jgi:hypothetical protein
LLANTEFSSDESCLKYAAFPKRNPDTQVLTTTRGEMKNWKTFTFKTWQELISALGKFQKVKNYIGWFFMDKDGPYYKISVNAFLSHIKSIEHYGDTREHYDFGWVGGTDDVGIIIGFTPLSQNGKTYSISIWGI